MENLYDLKVIKEFDDLYKKSLDIIKSKIKKISNEYEMKISLQFLQWFDDEPQYDNGVIKIFHNNYDIKNNIKNIIDNELKYENTLVMYSPMTEMCSDHCEEKLGYEILHIFTNMIINISQGDTSFLLHHPISILIEDLNKLISKCEITKVESGLISCIRFKNDNDYLYLINNNIILTEKQMKDEISKLKTIIPIHNNLNDIAQILSHYFKDDYYENGYYSRGEVYLKDKLGDDKKQINEVLKIIVNSYYKGKNKGDTNMEIGILRSISINDNNLDLILDILSKLYICSVDSSYLIIDLITDMIDYYKLEITNNTTTISFITNIVNKINENYSTSYIIEISNKIFSKLKKEI